MMDFFVTPYNMRDDHSGGNFYLSQVVYRLQDFLLELDLVLHQFTCQAALRLAAGLHHSAAHTLAAV